MQYFIVGLLVAVVTAYLTVKAKALTIGGATAAGIMILCVCLFGGWFGLVFLLSIYALITLVDRVVKDRLTKIIGGINKKHGPRDIIQVAANGLPATISLGLYALTGQWVFLIGYAVGITEAMADSVASDIGVLSKKDPVSICRFRRIPKGLSGGVSLLGSSASIVATLVCAGIYYLFFFDLFGAAMVVLFGNIGCLIDSILGDMLQEKFQCGVCGQLTEKPEHCGQPTTRVAGIPHLDNCLVNLISNALSVLIAVLALAW